MLTEVMFLQASGGGQVVETCPSRSLLLPRSSWEEDDRELGMESARTSRAKASLHLKHLDANIIVYISKVVLESERFDN
eukprot:147257-Hanusia_phi.AAC.3